MTLFDPAVFFAFGAVCASFIGLVSVRLHTGATILTGRSRCDSCGHTLTALDLVPVLSWLLSAGRCRFCKVHINASSTLTELALGALFVLAYIKLGLTPALAPLLSALVLLTGLVLYDMAHGILPPVLLSLFVTSTLVFATLSSSSAETLALTLCVALLEGSFLAVIHLASSGRAMGLADAPLVFGLALIAGPALAVSGFLFSFWIGGVVGILLLARRARGIKISSEVPFAPFLAAGYLLAYFTSCSAFQLTDLLLRTSGA